MAGRPDEWQARVLACLRGMRDGHAIVNAVAGSGKSTTLRFAAEMLCKKKVRHIRYFTFNRAMALNFARHALVGVHASTVHSAGMTLLSDALSHLALTVDERKYVLLADRLVSETPRLYTGFVGGKAEACSRLVELCTFTRLTLADPTDEASFATAAQRWQLECPPLFAAAISELLARGARQAESTGKIDFADMLYLPYRWNLRPRAPIRHMLCDEVQDFSAAELDLLLRHTCSDTVGLWVGDPRQAIMGFAFAGFDSYEQVRDRLRAQELPLSVCYRCPPNHLELVRSIVPAITAVPGRAPGPLEHLPEAAPTVSATMPGDLVLCRTIVPLIHHAARLLSAGKPVHLKDQAVVSTIIQRLRAFRDKGATSRSAMLGAISAYHAEEIRAISARGGSTSAITRLDAFVEAMRACVETAPDNDVLAVARRLASPPQGDSVHLSTIHRAKGLEAARVWVLGVGTLGTPYRHQNTDQANQETNLRYVALTRSRNTLTLVEGI